MKRVIASIIFIFSTFILSSQELDTDKLDQYFDALEAHNKFIGSIALMRDGKIIYTKQVGFTDLKNGIKPNDNTKYRIGSISKTFTAALIFQAIEAGEITLDETINTYFPTIESSEEITISNLLNHRSGIFNFTNDKKRYLEYHTSPKSQEEMIRLITDLGSVFEPNSKAEYSNSNYVLLSYILEEIYGMSYAEILDNKIVKPIKLKNTYFGGKIAISNDESYSYAFNKKWKKQPETNTSIPLGAGGIISSPTDLTLFAYALFNERIVSKKSLEQMKEMTDNYGMGLFQIPFYDKVSYGHTGGIDGFSSVLGYFENEKAAFSFTSNGANYETNNISITLLSALFNKSYGIPSFETYKVKSKDLDKYLGIYSSETFPIKITITKSDEVLQAQATGQSGFDLTATDEHIFEFDRAGIVMEFNPSANQVTILQGGMSNILTKE